MKVRIQFETEDPEVLTLLREPRRSEKVAAALAVGARYMAIERKLEKHEQQLSTIQHVLEGLLKELSALKEHGLPYGDSTAKSGQQIDAGGLLQPTDKPDEKTAELERKAEILAARLASFGQRSS